MGEMAYMRAGGLLAWKERALWEGMASLGWRISSMESEDVCEGGIFMVSYIWTEGERNGERERRGWGG